MNLVDELLKSDIKKADELEKGEYSSKKLAKLLGKKDPVAVTISEISPRRLNDIVHYQIDSNGKMDFSRTFDAKLMMCVEGIVNPNLRDKNLQAYFGCKTAKDLCEKLFGSEVSELSDAISSLSGIGGSDTEEEVKN